MYFYTYSIPIFKTLVSTSLLVLSWSLFSFMFDIYLINVGAISLELVKHFQSTYNLTYSNIGIGFSLFKEDME